MALTVAKPARLQTDASTLKFYAPPPRPDLKKTKKRPVRRFKRKVTAAKGFTIGGRVLGPIWDLYVPAVKTDPTLAPKQPTDCEIAIKQLKKQLREVGIPSGTPGVSYSEEIRVILQRRWDVYQERIIRHKARAPYNSSTKRVRLMQKYCAERLTQMYERALLEEDFDTALLAIELGAPANWMTRRGDTPLTITLKSQQRQYIKPFFDSGVPIDRKDAGGWTPLCIAVQQKDLDVAQLLLQLGADPNKESTVDSNTKETVSPLMVAVCHPSANVDLVYLLLRSGSRVNQSSSIGRTALMFACRWRQIANARILLEEYANPAMIDKAGYTATEWVKYAARERILAGRREKRSKNERLRSAASSSSDVVDKIALLLGGQPKREDASMILQDDTIALNILEEELVDEMEAKMQQRIQAGSSGGNRLGIIDIPAASSREGAALELLKRGYSVYEVVAKWKEAIGGDSASVEDIQRVFAQRVSEQHTAAKKQLVRQSAAAAFAGNAAAAKSRRDEEKATIAQAEVQESLKNATSDALLEHYGIDDIVPEENEWLTDPRQGGPVPRMKPNTWLGYDFDARSFQMKPSQSMLVLAAHPSALIRNFTKRLLRVRAAEVVAQREEAALKRFELRTGRSRSEVKTRGQPKRLADSKAVLGKIDAQLSAQVAFGNFLSGYEGATKAMLMADVPDAEDPDEQAVIVLTQDELCANCSKRAARLRDLNNNKRLCEKCTLWMSQQPGLQHHRFKPIPPPGMNDGIMAQRQEHIAKEAKALKRVSGMVKNTVAQMRQTFQRVKRDLGSGKHLLPPLLEAPDGTESGAFESSSSTPRSIASVCTALTGMDSAPSSPRQNIVSRLKQIANADSQSMRRSSTTGENPFLAAVATKKSKEEFEKMEATKAARSSAVAAAAAQLLQSDVEYPTAQLLQSTESQQLGEGSSMSLDTINRLGKLPHRIETFAERHARVDSRPGSSRWEAGVRGLIGQAARERALRNKKKAELFRQTQMGDFKALEKLKKLVDTSSAISFGSQAVSRETAQRMANFSMLRQRPQTTVGREHARSMSRSMPPIVPGLEAQLRPQTSAADHVKTSDAEVAETKSKETVSTLLRAFSSGQDLHGSHEVAKAQQLRASSADKKAKEQREQLRQFEAEKRKRLLQKKKERLLRMTEDLAALQEGAAQGGEALGAGMGDEAARLIKLARSLENGHGIPAETAEEKKANILRRASVMQGQPLSPVDHKDAMAGAESAVGRQRVVHSAARTLGDLGFGAPGAGAHASSYFGENLASEFDVSRGSSGQQFPSALDRLTSVSAARRSMGGAIRNLAVESRIQQNAADEHRLQARLEDDARRATAKLRVQALYTRPSEISLAYVLLEQKKFDEARRVLTDLLAKQKTTLSEMHIGFVATLVALGRLQVQTGHFERAAQQLQEAQYMLSLHKVHPGNEDAFLAIQWLSAAYTGLGQGLQENAAVESYMRSLNAAFADGTQWERRKAAGAVSAGAEYENYNGQLFTEKQKELLHGRLVPILNASRKHRELQEMMAEDTRRQKHSNVAAARRARRQVRAKQLVQLETNWKIQQRWTYNRCFEDILYKEYPDVDPLTSIEAMEPARQKDEHDELTKLEANPAFYGAHADTDGHSDSSGDDDARPGSQGHTQALKLTACDNNLKAALSYSRWQQMLEKLAAKDGIEYSVKFLAGVLKYNTANFNRVEFGGDFDKQRQIEIIRANQAARIADLYIKHPQMLPIVPMNIRDRILAAQLVSPLPFNIFEEAFNIVWAQVKESVWEPFLSHALGKRFALERLLSLLLPSWSMSMIAKLAGGNVNTPATKIASMVRGVQARRKAAQLLHKRYHQLLSRPDRVPAAEEFLLKWMTRMGKSAEEIQRGGSEEIEQREPPAYWEYEAAEAAEEKYEGSGGDTEDLQEDVFGIDEHGFPWQYDADGYVVFADKDGVQFYRDDKSHCYFFDEDSQQVFFEPVPSPAAALEHMYRYQDDSYEKLEIEATGRKASLSVIAEANTLSEQPSLYSEPSITQQSEPPPVTKPKRVKARPKRVFTTKAEAGRVIVRIGHGFLGRLSARQRLLDVFRCEYREEVDTFVYVDSRNQDERDAPPTFLSADYPTVRKGDHPLTRISAHSNAPLSVDEGSQAAQQAAALSQRVPLAFSMEKGLKETKAAYPGLTVGDWGGAAPALITPPHTEYGDDEQCGFDETTSYPWMLDEYGGQRFTDGASLHFYRDEQGLPFYYSDTGGATYCAEAELLVPTGLQVQSFFARQDGSLEV